MQQTTRFLYICVWEQQARRNDLGGNVMAYQVGDRVVYGIHGVCLIVDVEEQYFGGEVTKYYVLQPVYDDKGKVFVPVGNERLERKMRRILSAEEINELIREMPSEDAIWIADDNLRKERYRQILLVGDRRELVRLIKTLYLRQQEQTAKGKKLYKNDEKVMKEAEKMLYEEFAHVLDIRPDQVLPFIMQQVEV